MKISARNTLKGKVTKIKKGAVAAQVHVDIGGGNTITSVITTDAVDDLGIDIGSDVVAVIKATEVMIANE
jgi:molybdopterin-binding protein